MCLVKSTSYDKSFLQFLLLTKLQLGHVVRNIKLWNIFVVPKKIVCDLFKIKSLILGKCIQALEKTRLLLYKVIVNRFQ